MTALSEDTRAHGVAVCWSCKGPTDAAALFCATCGAVQPPGQANHFARLGLPRVFALDLAVLDRAYFDRQRQLHPDRFARKTPRERAIAESQAASLNGAYETLRDPLRRAGHLLALAGHPLIDDHQTIDDPALLAEAMEGREALMEAEDAAAVAAVDVKATGDRDAAMTALGAALAAKDWSAARRLAMRCRYLGKLLEDARRRRGQLEGRAA